MDFTSRYCICLLIILALGITTSLAAPKKTKSTKTSKANEERISALYIKDSENGELRFLTGTGTGNSNQALNQFITQKQDFLEQLRPNTGTTGLNGLTTGTLGTLGTLTAGTGISSVAGTTGITGTNGVTPILIQLGNGGTGTNTGTGGISTAITGSSPIGDLLPQIIAQAVLGQNRRRQPNRNINRRRVVNNRRRNGNQQVYVIRPGRQG